MEAEPRLVEFVLGAARSVLLEAVTEKQQRWAGGDPKNKPSSLTCAKCFSALLDMTF